MSPCLCGAPDCRACGPAQGWHIHSPRCSDADGRYDCGQRAYGEDDGTCDWCGEPSATSICGSCQQRYEEEQASGPYTAGTVETETVACKFCGEEAIALTAHLHQGTWVGDNCCWDERLRMSE